MNFLKIIIFIGCALQLVHCGGQGNSEKEIKVARVENGVPKAEDGRIILSSQSAGAESLIIPEGVYEGRLVSKQNLENAIINSVDFISGVSDISLTSELYFKEAATIGLTFGLAALDDEVINVFSVSFNVTVNNKVFLENIQCEGRAEKYDARYDNQEIFVLNYCGNHQVVFGQKAIVMDMNQYEILLPSSGV